MFSGIPGYTRVACADFVLCVDWGLSSLYDNAGVYLRFPPLGGDDPEHDWQSADRQGHEVQIDDRGYDPETKSFNSPLHLTGAMKYASRPLGAWNTFVIEAQPAKQGPTAYDVKPVHERSKQFSDDELKQLRILPVGSRLEQGATYIDLNKSRRGHSRAHGEAGSAPAVGLAGCTPLPRVISGALDFIHFGRLTTGTVSYRTSTSMGTGMGGLQCLPCRRSLQP